MSPQSKERLAVDLESTDGGQIAVITLVDTATPSSTSSGWRTARSSGIGT
jgi:hypothetical protein